ncbi:MAG: hypothetical protein B7Y80_14420 [Hyphomicrobium sp. 32-62-53]|nr:MAG: hypothetical protein B7Y80_14420 [Hyphomicrobium sp. 32-62-53]
MKQLTAVLLSDGKPGHFRCAEGILAAGQRLRSIDATTVAVRRPRLVPTDVLAWLTKSRRLAPRAILRGLYGLDLDDLARPDLIVSAGGDTLAANIALARATGAANIFFGSLRRYAPNDFSLALNSYPADRPGGNQVRILKPSPADPSTLPVTDLDPRPLPRVFGLLVGGPSGDARWSERDWSRLFAFLQQTYVELGLVWIVSNSRRTPANISAQFAELERLAAGPVRRFVDVRAAGSGTLGELFAECGAVAVTADSSAMLSEAIWMRRPVVALRPANLALPAKEADYRRWLNGRHLFRDVELFDISAQAFVSALGNVIPLPNNPQVALAEVLAAKLPAVFGASTGGSPQ